MLRSYLRLFRLGNCAMGAVGTLLAVIVCVDVSDIPQYAVQTALSMLVVVLFTAGGNSLNDYYDRETDKRAHPERPIPSGKLTPHEVVYASVSLFTLALVVSVAITIPSLAIVATSILVMLAYEMWLKAEGFAGNIAIGWLTGALFLFGGAAVGRLNLVLILAALAFLATLGREIVKDIQDIEGDRSSRRTLPMRIGQKNAGYVAAASFVVAVALSPLPYLQELSSWYVPAVAVADGVFIYCALILFKNPERGQKMAKLAMAVALVAFLLGGVLN
jgi:geranylgeranylglycerol-phosphate geranylgeranyltransferase